MLVARVVTGVRSHIYQRQSRFFPPLGFPEAARTPGRELWIMHPAGEPASPAPDTVDPSAASRDPDILVLDGTWRQAGDMLRDVEGIGRRMRLPKADDEPSRFWLRDQAGPGQLSTAEAVMGVFALFHEDTAVHRLRLHFELHVYATLLARGKREMAERYLGNSPLLTEAPDALDRLHAR
jgi:DTW domain-containing protein YfiP